MPISEYGIGIDVILFLLTQHLKLYKFCKEFLLLCLCVQTQCDSYLNVPYRRDTPNLALTFFALVDKFLFLKQLTEFLAENPFFCVSFLLRKYFSLFLPYP